MNKNILKRVNSIADYILKTNNTIRKTAEVFNISKSTVHKDIKERLIKIDKNKYQKVQKIMNEHIATRHIKGGESTKQLFLRKKQLML